MNAWLAPASRPWVIAHRGASAEAPENTLRAFRLGREQGADGIECDIHLSADHIPIILHDATLDRTTNAHGPARTLTAAQLQHVDAGQGECVPTLDQLFETLGRDCLYNLELKEYGWSDRGCAARVAERIQAHNLADQIVLSSFDPRSLYRARRLMPAGVVCALLHDARAVYTTYLFHGQVVHPNHAAVTPRYMAWARRHGLRVHVWTVDEPALAQRLRADGVHAIITNYPARLLAAYQ